MVFFGSNVLDLNEESMKLAHKENSLQYYILMKNGGSHELIFDDHGSAEIADLLGVNQDEKTVYVLYTISSLL